jgi:hypothetical protein
MVQESQPKKRWKAMMLFLIGMPVGLVGYFVGDYVAEHVPQDQLFAWLGPPKSTDYSSVDTGLMTIAFVYVIICLLSAVLFIFARFNKAIGEKSGVLQMVGTGESGRHSLLPLAIFYVANGGLIVILAISDIVTLNQANAIWMSGAGVLLALIMAATSARLWHILDELVRVIWVEALAITSLVFLTITMAGTIATSSGLIGTMSAFHAIIWYHMIYMAVYVGVTYKRAPELLGLLEAEQP